MEPFRIAFASDPDAAIATVTSQPHAAYIAGGTTVVDLMKNDVSDPRLLVDIEGLPYKHIERTAKGGVLIGALATMSQTANDPLVVADYPVVSQALLASASGQLRNMATIGGNVLQRTRCYYFRDSGTPCNKRRPGEGCTALDGVNRIHAVLGGSDHCICTHPSDLSVALLAVDAIVHVRGPRGDRQIPFERFYKLPGTTPNVETALAYGELVTGIELPHSAYASRSHYLKVRDRRSYEFALVSAAANLDIANGTIREARLALGGVAPVPWRSKDAEAALVGKPATIETFRAAAAAAMHGAVGRAYNAFKIPLAQRTAIRALATVAGLA